MLNRLQRIHLFKDFDKKLRMHILGSAQSNYTHTLWAPNWRNLISTNHKAKPSLSSTVWSLDRTLPSTKEFLRSSRTTSAAAAGKAATSDTAGSSYYAGCTFPGDRSLTESSTHQLSRCLCGCFPPFLWTMRRTMMGTSPSGWAVTGGTGRSTTKKERGASGGPPETELTAVPLCPAW